jgi:NIPSNAP protein
MLAQIRLYTINKGEMDAFLKSFQEVVIPLHERVRLPILATWVNRSQNEFIWVRGFEDQEDKERKLKAFRDSPQMADVHSKVADKIAKMEVRDVERAFVPSPARS